MKPKIILCPGWTEYTYVGAGQLADCYKVRLKDCLCWNGFPNPQGKPHGVTNYILLFPRTNGEYYDISLLLKQFEKQREYDE